jgi:hypothetical protein
MIRAALSMLVVAFSPLALCGVEQCLEYRDNRSVAGCVERYSGPVPVRKATVSLASVDARRIAQRGPQPDAQMRPVRLPPSRDAELPPTTAAISMVETTARSLNPWYLIVPGLAILVIVIQLAGRAFFDRAGAYPPRRSASAGAAQAGGLVDRIVRRYRRCPYCGARARPRSGICSKCLRALPA